VLCSLQLAFHLPQLFAASIPAMCMNQVQRGGPEPNLRRLQPNLRTALRSTAGCKA
jgi:hypothetical protein